MRRAVAGLLLLALPACGGGSRVVVAVGTTLDDSGFFGAVVEQYREQTGGDVSVVGGASLNVLDLGAAGEADVLFTHHPAAESRFLAAGTAIESAVVFESSFLLLAPPGVDLGEVTLRDALQRVAADSIPFVSRRDDSGTAAYEAAAWADAGIDPVGRPWFTVTGSGMGDSLLIASQRKAVILSEEGAYREAADALALVPVPLTDEHPNPYRVTLMSEAGRPFYRWLTSGSGGAAIDVASVDVFGEILYRSP